MIQRVGDTEQRLTRVLPGGRRRQFFRTCSRSSEWILAAQMVSFCLVVCASVAHSVRREWLEACKHNMLFGNS